MTNQSKPESHDWVSHATVRCPRSGAFTYLVIEVSILKMCRAGHAKILREHGRRKNHTVMYWISLLQIPILLQGWTNEGCWIFSVYWLARCPKGRSTSGYLDLAPFCGTWGQKAKNRWCGGMMKSKGTVLALRRSYLQLRGNKQDHGLLPSRSIQTSIVHG